MNKYKDGWTVLTPELAKELLESNYEQQRAIRRPWAVTLANDIKQGNWNEDTAEVDPIVVSTEAEKLLNGQHRCMAVILANKCIGIKIKHLSESVFDYIDGGKSRAVKDFLKCPNKEVVSGLGRFAVPLLEGAVLGNALHGIIKQGQCEGKKANVMASRTQILAFCDKYEDVCAWCATAAIRLYSAMNRNGSKPMYANAFFTILAIYGDGERKVIENMIEDFKKPVPDSSAVTFYKSYGKDKALDAAKGGMQLPSTFWYHLILSAYLGFRSNSKGKKKIIDDSLDFWNHMIDEVRSKNDGALTI